MSSLDQPRCAGGDPGIAAIPVRVRNATWICAVALVALFGLAPGEVVWRGRAVAIGFCVFGVIFVSILLHEVGHAVAARAVGIATERIELMGLLGKTILERPPDSPRSIATIAAGGPAVNAALMLAALTVGAWSPEGGTLGVGYALFEGTTAQVITAIVFVANAELLFVSLLPGLPLDGGQLLRALVWRVSGDGVLAILWPARVGVGLGAGLCALGLALTGSDLLGGAIVAGFGLGLIYSTRPFFEVVQQLRRLASAEASAAG